MAESDRSRSPVPGRNRADPSVSAQQVRPELPFFPRWCGPMQTAIWQSQRLSRPQLRPQFRPQFNVPQPGPYIGNQPLSQISASQSTSWSNPRFPPAPPPSPPPTLAYLSILTSSIHSTLFPNSAMSTYSIGLTQHSFHPFVPASSSWHSICELTRRSHNN